MNRTLFLPLSTLTLPREGRDQTGAGEVRTGRGRITERSETEASVGTELGPRCPTSRTGGVGPLGVSFRGGGGPRRKTFTVGR